jgi:hypothetical protein
MQRSDRSKSQRALRQRQRQRRQRQKRGQGREQVDHSLLLLLLLGRADCCYGCGCVWRERSLREGRSRERRCPAEVSQWGRLWRGERRQQQRSRLRSQSETKKLRQQQR